MNNTLLNFLDNQTQIAYIEQYADLLSFVLGREKLRAALVGVDNQILSYMEVLSDKHLSIHEQFAGPEGSIFYQNKPLSELNPAALDVIIVSEQDPDREQALIQQLLNDTPQLKATPIAVFLFRRSRTLLYAALSHIEHLPTCLNSRKLFLIALGVSLTANGALVECGTYMGGATALMGMMLRLTGDQRKLHAFDTFEGMPAPTTKDGETIYQNGLFTETGYDHVRQFLNSLQLTNIELHKGLVEEQLPRLWQQETSVSFALLDTDQYSGTLAGLKNIIPRLAPNGLILVDDYGVQGVEKAVAEVCAEDPKIRGRLMTGNFYLLWKETNSSFLSHFR